MTVPLIKSDDSFTLNNTTGDSITHFTSLLFIVKRIPANSGTNAGNVSTSEGAKVWNQFYLSFL